MRLLFFIFLSISLVACVNDDEIYFEPDLSMLCTPQQPYSISLQDVQIQYQHYNATTTQVGSRVTHEVISPINGKSSQTEYFEFQIDTKTGCAALAKHSITFYGSNGAGKTQTSIQHFPVEEFYFTQFEKQTEGELAGKTFFAGKNEGRKFFLIF